MKEKILVIEDEQRIADATVYALNREGYVAEAVYHGEEAIRKIKEFQPDAIVLDVMLPGMDGYEILKKLPENERIGIIMLTAKEDIVNRILGLELTPKENDLLKLLLISPDRAYTREQLLDQVWGMDYYGGTRTVDMELSN